jgi:hypothetical protein
MDESRSQGVALGWYVLALSGRQPAFFGSQLAKRRNFRKRMRGSSDFRFFLASVLGHHRLDIQLFHES